MSKKILLVEDNVILALSKQQELARYNYETAHVTTGEKAVDLVCTQNKPIDLILMDIDLGRGIDGTEAARQILEHKEIPIVFLSNHEEPEIVEKTEKITSYGYVVKSSSITVLDASIKMAFKLFDSQTMLEQELRERKILEKKIIDDERKTKTLLQESPICTKIVDTDFNLQFMSDAGFGMLGLDKSDRVYGKPYPFSFFPDDFRKQMLEQLEEAKTSKETVYTTGRTTTVKGDEVYLQSTIVPILDINKKIEYFIVFSIDITGQASSRIKLEESEMRFKSFMSHFPGAAFIKDRENKLLYCNEQFSRMLDKSPEEIIGTNIDEDVDPEVEKVYQQENKEVIEHGRVLKSESIFPYEGITTCWLTYKFPLEMKNKKLLGAVSFDITDLKTAEEEAKKSEARHKSLLQAIPDMVFLLDSKGTYIDYKSDTAGILTLPPKEFIGRTVADLLPSRIADQILHHLREVLKTKEIQHFYHEMTFENVTYYFETHMSAVDENHAVSVVRDITSQREVVSTLAESEKKYKTIFEGANDAIFVTDGESGKIIDANKKAETLLGRGRDDIIGMNHASLVSAAETQTARSEFRKTLSLKSGSKFKQFHVQQKNGNVIPVEVSPSVVEINGKKIIYGIFRDISEHKRTEQILKESEERYKKAQATAHIGSWEYDIETDSFWASEEGKRIFGFDIDKDNFSGEEVIQCIIEKEQVDQSLKDLIERNIPYDIEFTISSGNSNEKRMIHSVASLDKNEEGNPSKVIGTIQDVTDIKLMEKEVRESQENFKAYVENANDIIFTINLDGIFTYVSPNWKNMLGHDVEEVTGQSFIPYVHPDDVHNTITFFNKVITTGESQMGIEYRVKHKQGYYVWHSSTGAPIKDHDGNVVSFVGIARDVTVLKNSEQELRQALQEKDYLMQELNHRVKNSLSMVSSLISLKGAETEMDFSDIQNRVAAISLIYEKLYQSENVSEINCRDYFGDLLNSVFSSFAKRGVRIEEHIGEIGLPTKTALSLGLIINEIATNAIKYGFTDTREAIFSITMRRNPEDGQHELILSNTGNPFPEDVDPQSTATFGLRLINALVSQIGGTLELQKKPGPVFTIRFPVEKET